MQQTTIPEIETVISEDGKYREFFCKYCEDVHRHGLSTGHRSAHCKSEKSPYKKTGYILTCNHIYGEIIESATNSEVQTDIGFICKNHDNYLYLGDTQGIIPKIICGNNDDAAITGDGPEHCYAHKLFPLNQLPKPDSCDDCIENLTPKTRFFKECLLCGELPTDRL